MNNKIRSFIALDLPEKLKQICCRLQTDIDKSGLVKGKFILQKNLHLTLKFLGDIDEEKFYLVGERLEKLCSAGFDFPVESGLSGIGVFTPVNIRVIWIGLECEGINLLKKSIDSSISDMFLPDTDFVSHITIMRVNKVIDISGLMDLLNSYSFENRNKFVLNSFSLVKSKLSHKAAVYETAGRYNMNQLSSLQK